VIVIIFVSDILSDVLCYNILKLLDAKSYSIPYYYYKILNNNEYLVFDGAYSGV